MPILGEPSSLLEASHEQLDGAADQVSLGNRAFGRHRPDAQKRGEEDECGVEAVDVRADASSLLLGGQMRLPLRSPTVSTPFPRRGAWTRSRRICAPRPSSLGVVQDDCVTSHCHDLAPEDPSEPMIRNSFTPVRGVSEADQDRGVGMQQY